MRPVAIVGGGISGLAAAYQLAKAGLPCRVIERRPRLGGVIYTETVEGCLIEGGPDSFLSAKPWAMDLIDELGLRGEVIGSNDHLRVTYVLRKGRLVPLPDGLMLMVPTRILPMLTTPLVGWSTKLRMGLECLRTGGRVRTDDASVADFIRDHYGQEAVDYLAEPLLAGVYGGDPEQLSVNSVLGTFAELERKYGSLSRGVLAARRRMSSSRGSRTPLFQTLKSGLGALTEALHKACGSYLEVIQDEALAVERNSGGFRLRLSSAELAADHVVLACPAYEAGKLLSELAPVLANDLKQIQYQSSVTVSLGYAKRGFDAPQDGFGFLVPKKERRRLVACTWVGTKFSYRVPDDKILLRCFLNDEPLEDDETLVGIVCGELKRIMGLKATPLFSRVHRWPRSMAQYTVGHHRRVEAIMARAEALAGLYLAGNAYSGIGVPDCARMGREAAARIMAWQAGKQ